MKRLVKALSLALCLALVLSCMPAVAETAEPVTITYVRPGNRPDNYDALIANVNDKLAEDGELIVADWRIRLGADCIAEIRMGIGAMLLKAITRCKIAAACPGASWLDGGSGAPALTEAERMECVRLADTVSCRALEA